MPIAKIFASDARPVPVVRRKRTDLIVEAIKQMIVEQGLGPGDRLPQEKELMAQFSAGKSTVREALKALEVQGLISVRTGPGGGPFIARMSEGRAMSLLSNFLFARNLTMAHVQAMRAALEPLAAVSAIGHIDEAGFRQLNAILAGNENPELDFFGVVAGYSDNPMLAFTCRFLQRLIKEAEQDGSVSPGAPAPRLRELLMALRQTDDAAVRALLTRHFADFKGGETRVMERFLAEPDLPGRTRRRHDS
ncbi:Transcriptional regulator, GntR family [Devosia sp. LC5]|uniref:FadR/GntR family transcriptional regulator n=1 Tax=Devosia sp. LC5 TaxID=1502724 RepID=UPI0004E3A1FB|nr:GntR family transcriptional regulator [Devosia sp. LC5]KFC66920.1 Transcriptional regulator, GntR family [Devosia sp. LC5]